MDIRDIRNQYFEARNSNVDAYEGSYVVAHKGSNVDAYADSRVYAYEGSRVVAHEGSYVNYLGRPLGSESAVNSSGSSARGPQST